MADARTLLLRVRLRLRGGLLGSLARNLVVLALAGFALAGRGIPHLFADLTAHLGLGRAGRPGRDHETNERKRGQPKRRNDETHDISSIAHTSRPASGGFSPGVPCIYTRQLCPLS